MITTTLKRIRARQPCESSWRQLLSALGKTKADSEPLPFAEIVRILGLEDALWACKAEPEHNKEWRMFSIWCAHQIKHRMKDPRSIAALWVAERFVNGKATKKELAHARSCAWDAVWSASNMQQSSAAEVAWACVWDEKIAAHAISDVFEQSLWATPNSKRQRMLAALTKEFLRIVS